METICTTRKKLSRQICTGLCALALLVVVLLWTAPGSHAATVMVGNAGDLQAALNNGDDVQLTGSFSIGGAGITVPAAYNGTITGGTGVTLTNAGANSMFGVDGTVAFNNVILDQAGLGRALWITATGDVTLADSQILNGLTIGGNPNGGGIYMLTGGASLTTTGTTIIADCKAGETGGGISAFAGSAINIGAGTIFRDNACVNDPNASGYGGAISIAGAGSTLTVDGAIFTGNNCTLAHHLNGRQGAGICAIDGAAVTVRNSTFNIAKGFNLGGGVYCRGTASASITNNNFVIDGLGDAYCVGGGAIVIVAADSTISNNAFVSRAGTGAMPKAIVSGGFIDFVGAGNQTIDNNTFTREGSTWPCVASFGGAICFEAATPGCTATISNCSFTNCSADQTGGAISVGQYKNAASGHNVTITNCTFTNCTTWGGTNAGGAVMVSPGNTVTINGGTTINGCGSGLGGAVYNAGTTTMTGGAKIMNTVTGTVYGGVYNVGALTLDDVSFTGNNPSGGVHPQDATQYPGSNVYAAADVTITPNAVFDGGDVRVLDSKASILLTGALTRPIQVSISETGPAYDAAIEPGIRRYAGYLVAKGTGGYIPTKADLTKLIYKSMNADVSTDNTARNKWVFVLKADNTVVVGQNVALVYHPNGTGAAFAAGTAGLAAGGNLEQTYTIDSPTSPTMTEAARPNRANYTFENWYKVAVTDNDVANSTANATSSLFGFPGSAFFGPGDLTGGKLTTLVGDMDIFAGWRLASHTVSYHWVSADNPTDVVKPADETVPVTSTHTPQTQAATSQSYRFEGWFTDAACTIPYTGGALLTANLNLYGRWVKRITVTYSWTSTDNPTDAALPGAQTIDVGQPHTPQTQGATAQSYRFEGWFTDAACTTAYTGSAAVTRSFTLYGRWVKRVTVSYRWVSADNPTDVAVPGAQTFDTGQAYTAKPQTASAQGYIFAGWYTDVACTAKFVDGATVPADMTLYGRWSKIPVATVVLPSTGDPGLVFELAALGTLSLSLAVTAMIYKRRKTR